MMNVILQGIAAYIITVTAAILVEAPKSLIFKTGFCGAFGYIVYYLILPYLNMISATLLACIVISMTGQIFARLFKAPVTIFYIPSFFTLVPGAAIYRTAFYLIQGDSEKMSYHFIQTLLIAGAIALSVFIVDSFLEIYHHLKR
ncbi:threonine/serine exporter family protein [Tuanshanicoccus lijuaniae]|uniref:threonine/serine exporter family protein n=1 Tax=Aerococcaceae bacterium zg-1292 TaxID=2774330 RepID=UPI00385CCCFC